MTRINKHAVYLYWIAWDLVAFHEIDHLNNADDKASTSYRSLSEYGFCWKSRKPRLETKANLSREPEEMAWKIIDLVYS